MLLAAAAKADGIPSISDVIVEKLKRSGEQRPSVADLPGRRRRRRSVALCAELRALQAKTTRTRRSSSSPINRDVPADKGEAAGVTDWLTRPYSLQYARSRLRAWMMRSMLRWRKAALPTDEEERLAAVHRLGLLDTDSGRALRPPRAHRRRRARCADRAGDADRSRSAMVQVASRLRFQRNARATSASARTPSWKTSRSS